MRYEVLLHNVATVNGWTIKERTGQPVKVERLRRYTVWRGDRCFEEFRFLRSARRWARVNSVG